MCSSFIMQNLFLFPGSTFLLINRFLHVVDQNFFLSNDLKIVTIYSSAISYTIEILKCPSKATKRCY